MDEHGVVGDAGAADGLAALAGGLVAFQGAVADVLAFHAGQGRQHGEHDAGGVVRALQLPGEELQADVARLQLLGEHGQFDAAAEPLVLVDDEGDRDAGGAQLPGEGDGLVELGPLGGAGGDLLGEDPGDARPWRGSRAGRPGTGGRWRRGRSRSGRARPARRRRYGPGQLGPGRPGLAYGRGRHVQRLGERGTSRNRAVWYWMATLPLPVRHGEPAGAAQVDIGQSRDSTRWKSSLTTRRLFHGVFQASSRLQRPMKQRIPWSADLAAGLFHRPSPKKQPPASPWPRPAHRPAV